MAPIVHLMCKALPQRCQIRNLREIISNYSYSSDSDDSDSDCEQLAQRSTQFQVLRAEYYGDCVKIEFVASETWLATVVQGTRQRDGWFVEAPTRCAPQVRLQGAVPGAQAFRFKTSREPFDFAQKVRWGRVGRRAGYAVLSEDNTSRTLVLPSKVVLEYWADNSFYIGIVWG